MKLVVKPVFVYNYNVNLAVNFSYPTWTGVKTGVFNARVRAINYLSEKDPVLFIPHKVILKHISIPKNTQ